MFAKSVLDAISRLVSQVAPLLAVCEAFIVFCKNNSEAWPSELWPSIVVATNTMKCIVALINPVPGACGSSLSHVDYVLPAMTSKIPGLVTDFPRFGKLLVAKLRKIQPWIYRTTEFRWHVGAAEEVGVAMLEAETVARRLATMRDMSDTAAQDDLDFVYDAAKANLSKWRESLRPGATNELEDSISGLFLSNLEVLHVNNKEHQLDGAEAIDLANDLLQVAQTLGETRSRMVTQRILSFTTACQDTLDTSKLTGIFAALKDTPDSAVIKQAAKAICDMPRLEPEMHLALQDTSKHVLKWLSGLQAEEMLNMNFGEIATLLKKASLAHAKQWEAIVQKFADIQVAFATTDSGGRQVLPKCSKAFLSAAQYLAGLNVVDEDLERFKQQALVAMASWRSTLKDVVSRALMAALGRVTTLSVQVAQVSGGGPNGSNWHDCMPFEEDILDVYKKTLDVVDRDAIEVMKNDLSGAVDEYESLVSANREALAGDNVEALVADAEQTIKTAKGHIVRCLTTWCENMICQTLIRGGKSEKQRCESFTSSLSSQAKLDWKKCLHPDLVTKVSLTMIAGPAAQPVPMPKAHGGAGKPGKPKSKSSQK